MSNRKRPFNRRWIFRFNRQNLKLRIWSTSFQHDRFTSRPASFANIDAENPGYTTNEVSGYYGNCVITVQCHVVSTRHFQGLTPKNPISSFFSRPQTAERTLEAPVLCINPSYRSIAAFAMKMPTDKHHDHQTKHQLRPFRK